MAGIEKVLPNLWGELVLAHEELNAWRIASKPNHAVPLLPPWAFIIAYGLCRSGLVRVAAILLIQVLRGLRPGGLLGLFRDDLVPAFMKLTPDGAAHPLLGPRREPKADGLRTSAAVVIVPKT